MREPHRLDDCSLATNLLVVADVGGAEDLHQVFYLVVELLVVIGILAALVGVATPDYLRFFGGGETSAHLAEAPHFQAAMNAMTSKNGRSR